MSRVTWCLVAMLALSRQAMADGGVPIASLQGGHGRCTLVMQPAQPAVGAIAFEVLGAGEAPVHLTLLESGAAVASPVPLSRDAATGHWRGTSRFDAVGVCEVTLVWGSEPAVIARVQVQPAPAPWQAQWPWLMTWIAPGALLVARQRAKRRRIYTAHQPHG